MGYYADEARKAEKKSDWWEAVKLWRQEGGDYGVMESRVCQAIADAIALGDRYRELVGDAHERWESHEINSSQLYEIQCKAHKEVYGN